MVLTVTWPRLFKRASHCPFGQKFVKKEAGGSRIMRFPRHSCRKPFSPRNLVHALEPSTVCNFPWLHMAYWQLAAVEQTGHAHPAGRLRPRLDKMNGHSSSVPFDLILAVDTVLPGAYCRDERGSVWSSSEWSRQPPHSRGCSGGLPMLCWQRERPAPGLSLSTFIVVRGSFRPQVPSPNSPPPTLLNFLSSSRNSLDAIKSRIFLSKKGHGGQGMF